MQIQISWLLLKPTDLDLHCLLRQGMSCSTREGLKLAVQWNILPENIALLPDLRGRISAIVDKGDNFACFPAHGASSERDLL